MGRPRRDMALVAAAGPLMNLTLAIISGVILGLVLSIDPALTAQESRGTIEELERPLTGLFLFPLAVMAFYSILVNVLLGIFNLIPIPPLDGGRILVSLLPPGPALALIRLEPYGMLILVGLLVFDRELRVIHTITSTVASGISGTILSAAIGWSEGMSP